MADRLVAFGTCNLNVASSGPAANLPFFGQYYGNALGPGHNAANTSMKAAGPYGTHFFFYAERTGVIERLYWERRVGAGYSAGDGGKYTFQIVAANPNTRLPLTGVAPVCKIDNVLPGNPGAGGQEFITDFTTTGQVVLKRPYCLQYINTHANPGSNYFSTNISHRAAFFVSPPADYREPAGINPANPGSSPSPVSGWTPVRIDGATDWYPWPAKGADGGLHYRRIGNEYLAFQYPDGQWVGFASHGGGAAYALTVSGNTQGRERFRVTRASRVVNGVFILIARMSSSTGNLIVTLESGPASDTSGNGTVMEQITVPHTAIYDVGGSWNHQQSFAGDAAVDLVPFVWVPFAQNRTLTLGALYNLRLSATGGLNSRIWCSSRIDAQGLGPGGSGVSWDQWESQRQVPWTGWEDSRGFMSSSNSGSSWGFFIGGLSPILFKCVP